jgi:tRNA(Leu) C34 or U34 (ribose-2'-O)-methylase TrmL
MSAKLDTNLFGIGVYHPKCGQNIGTLIRSAYIMGAAYVFTIGKRYKKQSSEKGFADKIPVFHYEDFESFRNSVPVNQKLVCIELDEQSKSLITYKHPKKAIYLLGAEDRGLSKEILEHKDKDMIFIPGKTCLNVSTAGSIVMYDRNLKNELKGIV